MTRDIEWHARCTSNSLFALQHHPDADRGHVGAEPAGCEVRRSLRESPALHWFSTFFFTVTVTNWRTQFRKTMNELDSSAHSWPLTRC
jgi:hypothetical protein